MAVRRRICHSFLFPRFPFASLLAFVVRNREPASTESEAMQCHPPGQVPLIRSACGHVGTNPIRLAIMAIALLGWADHARAARDEARQVFTASVAGILRTYCFDCHAEGAEEGGLDLKELRIQDTRQWHAVWSNLKHQLMPPSDMDQPSAEERQAILNWIEKYALHLDPEHPDPGAVTIRRLNREEYRWSIMDLFGVEYDTQTLFGPDDTGYGFDTVSDVQSLSPIQAEKYLKAARSIANEVFPGGSKRAERDRRWMVDGPAPEDEDRRQAYRKKVVRRLASAAFRRPVDEETLTRITGLAATSDDGTPTGFEGSIRTALTIVLVSPRFLFRAEHEGQPQDKDDPAKGKSVVLLDEYALASRLSYFLWSSVPDDKLRDLASKGKLREELRTQVDRMLLDPKADRFYENFVGQWLRVRDVMHWPVDEILASGESDERSARRVFNASLRMAMQRETYELFEYLMDENRSLRDLLTADYSFLNDRLARFYGLPRVQGSQMRKVDLPDDSPRQGVLTHGSILMVTSNPNRTSPVKRGVFILDNILGTPPPPPPPDVPALEEVRREGRELTMRQRLAIHREAPLCASCHNRMDPLGLAFESFNIAGRYREESEGQPIDTSGVLLTGESFTTVKELGSVLANERQDDFFRCLSEKMLTYALGRGLEYYDIPSVDGIVDALKQDDAKARTLVYEIVESPPFQLRRSDPAGKDHP